MLRYWEPIMSEASFRSAIPCRWRNSFAIVESIEEEALIFNKAVVKCNVLYCSIYRRNNNTIGLNNKAIVEIVYFILVKLVTIFGNNVICSSQLLKHDGECGSCCSHINFITGYEATLRMI